MNITPYTQSTLPAWLNMRAALFHDEDPKLLEQEVLQITKTNTLKSQPFQCLLAFDDSNPEQPVPIGFIELTIRSSAEECMTSPVLYIEGWYVDPAHQGTGVGRALMNAAFDWGRKHNCQEAASDARPDNTQSISAHHALGFQDAGVIHCFKATL
ncbi:MAG: GNAT family N-acetyltransferase [Phycisphaerales bacterium]|nr:GNAT family N-acetyltransferase [Phycisphaerales bacterium]